MNTLQSWLVLIGISILGNCPPLLADADTDYKTLFGAEEAKVAASRSTKDAAEFASKLLNAAKSVAEQKDLQALLCEKAYEFASKDPSGQQTAVDALKLLGEVAPDKKAQAQGKLLKVLQARFTKSTGAERKRVGEELAKLLEERGDERAAAKAPSEAMAFYRQALSIAAGVGLEQTNPIADKMKRMTTALAADKKLADLKARLEANPSNVSARMSLILIYLGEVDNPVEAAKLVNPDLDEKYRSYLPLAAKPVGELDEGICLELAYWYGELADKASSAGKGVILGRAKTCAERYLDLHKSQDANRLKATMLLQKVEKDVASLARPGGADNAETQGQDLLLTRRLNDLSYWKRTRTATWRQVQGQIIGHGDGVLNFQQKLPANGVLEFTLQMAEGMRPRIYFRGFYLGNEGFSKEFGFHGGAVDRSGSYLPYTEKTVMHIRLTLDGQSLDLQVNDKPLAKAKRALVEDETLGISCGDDFSKGTARYSNFKFSRLPESPAPK